MLKHCTIFQKKVLIAVAKIPKGKVKTYGSIAHEIGKPKSSRAVGNALHKNPYPFIIPCHRVVRNNGELGGYAFGSQVKKRLLENEGVLFLNISRVCKASIL